MSVSYAVDFASLLLLGPNETMLVAVTSAWSQCTFRMKTKNPVYRTLFSMACLAITVQASGFAYESLGGVPGTLAHDVFGLARPLVGAATMYFIFNTCLIAVAVSLATKQSFISVWNQNFLWSAPSYFVGAAAAAIVTLAVMTSGVYLALLAAAPLYLTYRTYKVYLGRIDDERRHVEEMADLHLATIEALALAIDAKDQTAQSHIRRVQVYATSIARGLGMSDTEIQGVKTAALLHDIGKLAVPEHILSKPGPLTQEEFQKIRVHPQVGAEIISAVPFPYPVAPLILSHHERWDGKGYPQGLKGEEIPLGARILSVVDYYDALTSDRPYHKAMAPEAAMALLQQEAGRALDPAVVQMFVRMAAEMEAAAETIETATPRRLSLEPTNERGRPAVGFSPESTKTSTVFEDIALAHREIYALYEIAQTMGTSLGVADTMALISSKLSNLVPFSACALFLFDEEADSLRCRFATGVEADAIGTMTVRAGQGLAGWVARNRRPLVNARPSAEFEAAGLAKSTALQSALVAPLVFSDRFIGTLAVYSTQPDFYTDDHRRLLDRVSEQASAVIHNSIVFEQTHGAVPTAARPRPARRLRKSLRTTTRARRIARVGAARVPPAERRASRGGRGGDQRPDEPGQVPRARRGAQLGLDPVADQDQPDPVAVLDRRRRQERRGLRRPVGLGLPVGPEPQAGRDVDDQPERQRPLLDEPADVGPPLPRGDVPVEVADVVPRLVRPAARRRSGPSRAGPRGRPPPASRPPPAGPGTGAAAPGGRSPPHRAGRRPG